METSDSPDLGQCRKSSTGTAFSCRHILILFPLVLAILSPGSLRAVAVDAGAYAGASEIPQLKAFVAESPEELISVLEQAWDSVEMDGKLAPSLAPERLPNGLGELPVGLKKNTFVRAVLPLVLYANAEVAAERAEVEALEKRFRANGSLTKEDSRRLSNLARRYRVPGASGDVTRMLSELVLRVDQVPVSLALAQAALESGWGTSRFAVEGNSLFGQWVFSTKGMSPDRRPEGANYSVARFRDLLGSVSAYIRNLNTSWAYDEYRELRASMRSAESGRLDPLGLAGELTLYSSRREDYVAELRSVIRGNRLVRFDDARILSAASTASSAGVPDPERLAMAKRGDAGPPDA